MKTWLYAISGALCLHHGVHAQNANLDNDLDKKVHGGLVLGTGMLFTNFETNKINTNGLGSFVGLGFGANIGLSNNIGIYTGLEFHFERFGYKPNNETFFYDFSDKTILLKKENGEGAEGNMRLMERRQNTVAANIPLMLLFRTNMMGYFRYFGKFGLRNSLLLRQRVTDMGFVNGESQQSKLEGMRAANDMFFLRSAGGVAAGAEWNFASSTSLSVELGYYYGFTPVFHGNGKTDRNGSSLYQINPDNNEKIYRSFKASQNVLELKAILLF
jgi:hypothetical protein